MPITRVSKRRHLEIVGTSTAARFANKPPHEMHYGQTNQSAIKVGSTAPTYLAFWKKCLAFFNG